MTTAIVNLGFGNIGSIANAFERLGVSVEVTTDAQRIADARRVVLPGVGAAGYAMERIGALGLAGVLRSLRGPLLGICLGMQLLFEGSEEDGVEGLGIMPGRVRALIPDPARPVPHMGWSRLSVWGDELGLRDGDYVYFAHSFACDAGAETRASAEYGREIPAAAIKGNAWGAQFHPERSGEAGARFLNAWLAQ